MIGLTFHISQMKENDFIQILVLENYNNNWTCSGGLHAANGLLSKTAGVISGSGNAAKFSSKV